MTTLRTQLATALHSWLTDPAQGNGLLERLVPLVDSLLVAERNAIANEVLDTKMDPEVAWILAERIRARGDKEPTP